MNRLKFLWVSVLGSLLLLTPQTTRAGWTRTYGGDSTESAACVRETTDGGYVILGKTYSFGAGEDDIWLLKVNAEGDTVWTRTYGGEDNEYGSCLQVTKDGGFVIVGSTGSFGAGRRDIWLLKTDQYGDTLWSKLYGGDSSEYGCYVSEIEDSGYLIIGGTSSFGAGIYDIWVIRTNAAGDTVWTRTHGGEEEDWCFSANKTSDGIYVILAQLYSFFYGYCLVRVYTDGEIERLESYPAWRARYVTGDYVLTGCDYKSGAEPPYLWISKSDWYGWEEWHTLYGGENWEEGYCIETTDDGCYIVTGEKYYIDDSGSDLWLLKINAWGDTLWTRTYSNRGTDCGYFVQQTSDGGYIVLGETKFLDNGSYDLWLIKTDSLGYVDVKEESHTQVNGNWAVETPIGPQIVLRYADRPDGLHASIFDATGRKVDEIHSTNASGTITWGEGVPRGVYFIRVTNGLEGSETSRVVIIH